jgi:Flp pilus assembly protein TadG
MEVLKMKREKMTSGNVKKISRRKGGALIETAFVLPVLLGLVFGCVEYGYFFYMKNIGAAAARE